MGLKKTTIVDEIKARLSLCEVIAGEGLTLRPSGPNKLVCGEHDSLSVDTAKGVWAWFSQPAASGQDACGGDVLSWIAFRRYGSPVVDGDRFVEVLRHGARLAGLDYDDLVAREAASADPQRAERIAARRRELETLEKFCCAAEKARDADGEFWSRVKLPVVIVGDDGLPKNKIRKPYLTPDVVRAARIGMAPTLGQCKAAGLTEDELRAVGLLVNGARGEYMFFRDRMTIPFIEKGKVVQFAARALADVDQRGKPVARKILYLKNTGYIRQRAGYGLAALAEADARARGVWLVEGPLDAIAVSALGQPAIAMLTSSPTTALAKLLAAADCPPYLALDGTADVTLEKQCKAAAKIGPGVRVCQLPKDTDPDELTVEQVEKIKGASRSVIECWAELLKRNKFKRQEFAYWVKQWIAADPAAGGEIRADVASRLGLTADEVSAWLSGGAESPAPEKVAAASRVENAGTIGDPLTVGVEPVGEHGRPVLTNFASEKYTDARGNDRTRYKARPLDRVRDDLISALNGCLYRLRSPGSRDPVLFVARDTGGIRWLTSAPALKAIAAEYCQLKFRDKVDDEGANFVSWSDLQQSLGGSHRVTEYRSLELYPHEPVMSSSFYSWKWPLNGGGRRYAGNGEWIAAAVGLFNNIPDPAHRALFAAAIVTPFWGGPQGKRPAFMFVADEPGCGKGAAATVIGRACGGMLEFDLSPRGEERLKVRLLSPDGLGKRVLILDNAKGMIESPLLEGLITSPEISGHRLNVGEATRPNNTTVLITANDARVSPDMARRLFFIKLNKPIYSAEWENQYFEVVERLAERAAADALGVLRHPVQAAFKAGDESFGLWVNDVLARVVGHPLLKDLFDGVVVDDALARNREYRRETDEALAQAETLMAGLIPRLSKDEGFVTYQDDRLVHYRDPIAPVRLRPEALAGYWKDIFGKREISTSWASRQFWGLAKSGKITGVEQVRLGTGRERMFELQPYLFHQYLDQVKTGANQ